MKQFKKISNSIYYCYDEAEKKTIRLLLPENEISVYNFKFDGWVKGEYDYCTPEEFKAAYELAINANIKTLQEMFPPDNDFIKDVSLKADGY